MMAALVFWFFFPGFIFYFLPSIIAIARSHHRTGAIVLVNIFLGWTVIGWAWALVWSLTTAQLPVQVIIQQPASAVIGHCPHCGSAVERGARFCTLCGARLAA